MQAAKEGGRQQKHGNRQLKQGEQIRSWSTKFVLSLLKLSNRIAIQCNLILIPSMRVYRCFSIRLPKAAVRSFDLSLGSNMGNVIDQQVAAITLWRPQPKMRRQKCEFLNHEQLYLV